MIKDLLVKSARVFGGDSPNAIMLQEVYEQERRLIDLCALPAQGALAALDTGLRGLSSQEAEKRLDEYGPNELSHTRRLGFWADVLQRCKSPLVVQLLIIALISGAFVDPAAGAQQKEALASLFQTGWFVESLLTQTLIVHIIMTRRVPFFGSHASLHQTLTTLSIMGIGMFCTTVWQ